MKLLFSPETLTFKFKVPYMKQSAGIQKILGMGIGLKHHRVDYFPYWHRSNSILLGASAAVDGGLVKLWNYSYVDGKHVQEGLCVCEPNQELKVQLRWGVNTDIKIYDDQGWIACSSNLKPTVKSSIFGYLLFPYQEKDGKENKVIPFAPEIWDVKVNGKLIKCKFNK